MPKLALSYEITNNLIGKVSVSRGFSPPTIDEIRSSDNIVNTELQPENGWNFETGLRLREKNNRFWFEVLLFNYQLEDAIVRRLNPDNTEYFVNVGGTEQLGLEATLNLWIIEPRSYSFIRELQLRNSYTLSKFTFVDYQRLNNDYSGNKLTGVPEQIIISSLSLTIPEGIYFFVQYNYTSRIPLNDANSVFSNEYHLIQLKAGWQVKKLAKYNFELYAGVDNLLNEKYSLGNDLNAMGGRYYNPSPLLNFFGGIKLKF
jgi:iron complex outermembrane receptor protein